MTLQSSRFPEWKDETHNPQKKKDETHHLLCSAAHPSSASMPTRATTAYPYQLPSLPPPLSPLTLIPPLVTRYYLLRSSGRPAAPCSDRMLLCLLYHAVMTAIGSNPVTPLLDQQPIILCKVVSFITCTSCLRPRSVCWVLGLNPRMEPIHAGIGLREGNVNNVMSVSCMNCTQPGLYLYSVRTVPVRVYI
jgi:hypothetical protein